MSDQFQEKFPFISCVKSNDKEYVGIVINFDDYIASIYDLSMILGEAERKLFLEMGEVWWWESNRKIPINIFLKTEMQVFRPFIKTFNSKDAELVFGPTVNLSEIAEKRIKRKSIQLVRAVKSNRN
jgi:ribosomal protein L39E